MLGMPFLMSAQTDPTQSAPAEDTLANTINKINADIAAMKQLKISGYIQAQFQYCHAFAYISAQGALPTAPGASESYLGLILDAPGLYRTLQIGENLAH